MARRKYLDATEAITDEEMRRKRTGRSFFPAVNMEAQGQILIPAGGSLGGRALPPEQNPAYQAVIAKGRPNRANYTMIPTSTGFMSVPTSQISKYAAIINKSEPQVAMPRPNPQAAYAMGYSGGVPTGNTPYERSYRMGYEGGPVVRPEGAGVGFQIGQGVANIASGAGRRIAGLFRRPVVVAQQQYPNYYDYNPSPIPQPPRRYSDLF